MATLMVHGLANAIGFKSPAGDDMLCGIHPASGDPLVCSVSEGGGVSALARLTHLPWEAAVAIPVTRTSKETRQEVLVLGAYPACAIWEEADMLEIAAVDRRAFPSGDWPVEANSVGGRESQIQIARDKETGRPNAVYVVDDIGKAPEETEFVVEPDILGPGRRVHPWRSSENVEFFVDELRRRGAPDPIELPGGPYSLLRYGGRLPDRRVIVSADELVTILFDPDHPGDGLPDRQVHMGDAVTDLSPPKPPASNVPTVCLTMIVKNESAIIERALEAATSVCTCVCLCDTGSTDDTVEKATAYLDKHNVEARIFEHPFRDFGYSRTVAWLAARGMAHYQMFLDADHKLAVGPTFHRRQLVHDAYLLTQGTLDCSYHNLRLAKDACTLGCKGVTHEHWELREGLRPSTFNELAILDLGDGGCKADKFPRDLALLRVETARNPECTRSQFYYANTLRDMEKWEEAINAYKKRIDLGGWQEEVWSSYLSVGRCYVKLKNHEAAASAFLMAYEVDPARVENLLELVTQFRKLEQYRIAGLYCEAACRAAASRAQNPRLLFVEERAYRWGLAYEISLIAHYVRDGHPELINVAKAGLFQLLRRAPLPPGHLLKNARFYTADLASADEAQERIVHVEPGPTGSTLAWTCAGPVSTDAPCCLISGWIGRSSAKGSTTTTMVWSQAGQDGSVLGELAGSLTVAPALVAGQTVNHLVLPTVKGYRVAALDAVNRRLKVLSTIDGEARKHKLQGLVVEEGGLSVVSSWTPFSTGPAMAEAGTLPWRATSPLLSTNSHSSGTMWLLAHEDDKAETKQGRIYSVFGAGQRIKKEPRLSEPFTLPEAWKGVAGMWTEKDDLVLVSTPADRACQYLRVPMANIAWFSALETV